MVYSSWGANQSFGGEKRREELWCVITISGVTVVAGKPPRLGACPGYLGDMFTILNLAPHLFQKTVGFISSNRIFDRGYITKIPKTSK